MNKLCLLLLFSVVLFKATPQPGSLDPSFGKHGIRTTAFPDTSNTLSEEGRVVLIGANKDIFVVARLNVNGSYTRIVKYLADGRLDSSYGRRGYSNTTNVVATCALLQGNKIIVAGSISNPGIPDDIGLARYTADGTLDTSFGENGIIKTDFSNDQANAIMLQGDKIIVGGYADGFAGNYSFFLARFTANGGLDSSFGENGSITTDFNSSNSFVNAIILQGDKIIAAGSAFNAVAFNYDFALARYTANGRLDSSFGKKGKVTTHFGNSDAQATSLALQDNKILVAGFGGATIDFELARYAADGRLDSSFGKNGKVTTRFNNNFYNYAYAMTLQGDKILLAGESLGSIALARYTAEGALDPTFGKNGKVITDFNDYQDHAYSVALQGDKIIVGGSINGYPADISLVRYTANGALDSSFGNNGLVAGHFPKTQVHFTSTVIQGNKIIAAGYTVISYFTNAFALARFTADGALDSSFGKNGRVITNFDNSDQRANSVVLQGSNIIAGGYTGNPFNSNPFVLARYTADGTLDSTFGVNGKVTTDFDNGYDQISAIAMQGNKILVTGYAYNQENSIVFAVARYTAHGKLDSSFGENGKVTTDFGGFYQHANLLALQGNKIIAAGYVSGSGGTDFALARYTADGVLDPTFGVDGKVVTGISSYSDDQAIAMAMDGDKIILAGNSVDFFPNSSFVIVRYTADGMLDASFGENGIVTTDFVTSYGHTNSIAAQGDKIITGGNIGNSDFSFARYTDEGKLDSSFGENGKTSTDLTGSSALGEIAVYQNRLYAVGSLTFGPDESYGVVAAYQLEAPEPAITIKNVTVSESGNLAVATVRLSTPATQLVIVNFTTRDKTATHLQDYIKVSYPLLILPGFTTAQIFIPIVKDNIAEGTEQFEIVLTKAMHATILDSLGLVTILDDDNTFTANEDNQLMTGQEASLRINTSPNPYTIATTIQVRGGNNKQPASVRVYDLSGRLVEKRENIRIGQDFQLGDQYKAGAYIIEAIQGRQRAQTKVIRFGK